MIGTYLKRKRLMMHCCDVSCDTCSEKYATTRYCTKYNFEVKDKDSRYYCPDKIIDTIYAEIYGEEEAYNTMVKPELKIGMRVILRNGDSYLCMRNVGMSEEFDDCVDILHSCYKDIYLNEYNNYLTHCTNSELDIVKVEISNKENFLNRMDEIIYSEKERLTLKEIEERLGYKIELVKE